MVLLKAMRTALIVSDARSVEMWGRQLVPLTVVQMEYVMGQLWAQSKEIQ